MHQLVNKRLWKLSISIIWWGVKNLNLCHWNSVCKTCCKSTNLNNKVTSSWKNTQQPPVIISVCNYDIHNASLFCLTRMFFAVCCSEHCWCWCCAGSKYDVTMWHRTYDPWRSCIYGVMVQRQCWETSVQVGLHRLLSAFGHCIIVAFC